jgi:Tfp pilus assembly protein PilF
VLAAVIIAASVSAYATSFSGALMNDDIDALVDNSNLRSLWPLRQAMTAPADTPLAGRPVPTLTFALNYALAPAGARDAMVPVGNVSEDLTRQNLWGYHLFNLLVHVCAALLLLGVVRRTLRSPPLRDRFGQTAEPLAAATALLWALHPLQTEAVTFLVQRVESLMGLFYLATLYCAIRSAESGFASRGWTIAAVSACALGMGTKEVMATAPIFVAVWIYVCQPGERLTGRARWLLAGLAATWIIPVSLLLSPSRAQSVGFGLGGWTSWIYLRTQAAVLVHYLRLAFWPHPLVFHYGWLAVESWREVLPQALFLAVAFALSVVAVIRRRPIGLLGAWFFLILAPTSSILPIVSEVAAEHRMYLPLAAVVAGVVCGAYQAVRWLRLRAGVSAPSRFWPIAGGVAVGIVAAAFAWQTFDRNRVYASVSAMTADIASSRPENAQARLAHAVNLMREQRFAEAESDLRAALILPLPLGTSAGVRATMHLQLGLALCSQAKYAECVNELQQALTIDATLTGALVAMAEAQLSLHKPREALEALDRAIAAAPDAPRPLTRAAWILATAPDAAVRDGKRALEFASRAVAATAHEDALALDALAAACAEVGQFDRAVTTVQEAITVAQRQNGEAFVQILQNHLAFFERRQPLRIGDQ